jgi:hypothetical protein
MKRVLSSEPWIWICLHPCSLVNNLLRLHQFRIHCLPGLVEEIDFYLGHPGAQEGVSSLASRTGSLGVGCWGFRLGCLERLTAGTRRRGKFHYQIKFEQLWKEKLRYSQGTVKVGMLDNLSETILHFLILYVT